MEQVPPDTKQRTPSSRVLEDLLDQAPADYFTLAWLMSTLHQRSFGIVILFLGLLATAPIGSTVPGLVLAVVAVQMIAGRRELVFPRFITAQSLPTRYLFRLGGRAIPVLRYLEKAVHPRWPTALEAAKRFVGVMVLLLTAVLLLTPVPLSNIAPAICDRTDLPCIYRGRRTAALFGPSCRRRRNRSCVSGSLGNDRQRCHY
jgi:hypothetical protein